MIFFKSVAGFEPNMDEVNTLIVISNFHRLCFQIPSSKNVNACSTDKQKQMSKCEMGFYFALPFPLERDKTSSAFNGHGSCCL